MFNFPSYQFALEIQYTDFRLYERVYETEIGYSILLTTTAFVGIQPTLLVGYPPQTAPSPFPQVEKAAEHTGNRPLA